ncbi:NCA2-domain-containing protein [Choiromyces venosus 120613-1]|uniref:NCA2-domain-containing protein n=1 Tax=Choiromyces venosus 120613-1 TaxID=1336337 RepID=A0A3N4J0W8_9PEZI|nr:NCA2-domain-containing protein [Choiromyces venosus 120613-1]
MTFVSDQLLHLDAQIDRLALDRLPLALDSHPATPHSLPSQPSHLPPPTPRAIKLQGLIKSLSTTTSRTLLSPKRLVSLLKDATIPTHTYSSYEAELYETELEWLLLSKATIQTYGIVLNSLLEQTLPLSQDLFYWDEVAGSYRYTALYSLQTAPERMWGFGREVVNDARERLREREGMGLMGIGGHSRESLLEDDNQSERGEARGKETMSATARRFYALVRNSLRDRSLVEFQRVGALSPFSLARHEIRKKQAGVRKLREMQASALGVLIGEGLSFGFEEENEEWKVIVERAVLLMEKVVRNVSSVESTLDEFEETVFSLDGLGGKTDDDEDDERGSRLSSRHYTTGSGGRVATSALAKQLQEILLKHLPAQAIASRALISTHGRPSAITRYWLPATALLLSSSTILGVLVNRQAELEQWLKELGVTAIDFWTNWIVEPVRKIIGTVRHGEDSEVALMSRSSLKADMKSLERMVVDFAVDNPITSLPEGSMPSPLTDDQIQAVRQAVHEGDLTPVLKSYEQELRAPFKGAIRGELLRALLIQIQKTKVDVEVAISGIDHLLKSQELVFGMVGITPSVLVCVGIFRWVKYSMGKGKGRRSGQRSEEMVRTFRNVDRILTGSAAYRTGERDDDRGGVLTYKEHGLLLCEVHLLREFAKKALPTGVWTEFVEDVEELVDVRRGVKNQFRVLERIRWAYAKWVR